MPRVLNYFLKFVILIIVTLLTLNIFSRTFMSMKSVNKIMYSEDEFLIGKRILNSSKNLTYRYCIEEATKYQMPSVTWTITPKPCEPKTTIVLLIKSSIHRNGLRHSLRKTWAQTFTDSKIGHVQRIFVVGISSTDSKVALIEKENEIEKDILQVPFEDTFRNVSSKVITAMKFIKTYCSNAKLIIIADDDAVIMPWNLFSYIKFDYKNTSALDLFYGGFVYYNINTSDYRDKKARHYFSEAEYNCSTFAPYALGNAFIMSYKVMVQLYYLAQSFKFLFSDDIFLAVLANIANISLTGFPHDKLSFNPTGVLEPHGRPDLSHLITMHGADYSDQQTRVWLEMCYSKTNDEEATRLVLKYCSAVF